VLAAAAIALLRPMAGVEVDAGGRCLLFLPLADGEPLDLTWRHSVDGILVRDRFTRHAGTLYLTASYMPWFAAGLGDIAGRGQVVGTTHHGLAIVNLDEPLAGGLPLRVGSPDVAHTLHHRGRRYDLSARVPHRSVRLRAARRSRAAGWLCGAARGVGRRGPADRSRGRNRVSGWWEEADTDPVSDFSGAMRLGRFVREQTT